MALKQFWKVLTAFASLEISNMTIKITKQLATVEDLAIGTGTVVQERNGVPLTLTKIDLITASKLASSVTGEGASLVLMESGLTVEAIVNAKAAISGQVFTGNVTAPNLSGTNTGDQDFSGKANVSGQTFTGNISANNLSGTNTGDQTLNEIGVGQTWQYVTASRSSNTNYTNSTGKPIAVSVYSNQSDSSSMRLVVDGVTLTYAEVTQAWYRNNAFGIVPDGSVYRINTFNVGISSWNELR